MAQKISRLEKELARRRAENARRAERLGDMIRDLRNQFEEGMDRSIPAEEAH